MFLNNIIILISCKSLALGEMFLVLCFYWSFIGVAYGADSFKVACNRTEYFDPGLMSCQLCPANVSMVASVDGFSCSCEENSVPDGIDRCKKCNATEVVSADGATCVPRKCQTSSGRFICRKCPSDYISVTQNLDGSPTKEVHCVKCARGYKPYNNVCVRCPSCACTKNEVAVRGVCVLKRYVNERPNYEGKMHSTALLDVLKYEYLCSKMDLLACRALAQECVKSFYNADLAGPCRLWIQPKVTSPKGLPQLVITDSNEMKPGEFILARGKTKDSLSLILAVFTANGGIKILNNTEEKLHKCFLPLEVAIGSDLMLDCDMNITELMLWDKNSTYSVYHNMDGIIKPLSIVLQKPNGYYVKRETWSSEHFKRFFFVNKFVTKDNVTTINYLRTLLVRISIERDKYQPSSLRLLIRIEAQYSSKSPLSKTITTTLRVENDISTAGIFRGLEVWGGVLGSLFSLYAVAQWRGEMRRGGFHFSMVPHLAGCLSDALYFAVWFSTLHALAAEAGALGMTLPLSSAEEHAIKVIIYTALSFKVVKLVWINWKQCSCDIFFLDWSEYNSVTKDVINNQSNWRMMTLAKEWSRLQTIRRAPPSYTIILTLVVLQLLNSWRNHFNQSPGYKWTTAVIAWWSSYGVVLIIHWILYKVVASPPASLPKICKAVGISILVFEEEHYAHYVHGRNDDDKDLRLMSGPLSMCRVVMAPQLRVVYNQLSNTHPDNIDGLAKQALLSRLLAAFFERALDGLNWVASERLLLERLLNIELTDRESGTTSTLLYDPEESTPSCMALTWWGNEWSLGTMDAMIFGCCVYATEDPLLAALVTVVMWQVIKYNRLWLGKRNQRSKTNIDSVF